jgi:hypothetical protein
MDSKGKRRRALKLNHKGEWPKDQLQTKLAQILEDIKTEKRVCVQLERQNRLETLMRKEEKEKLAYAHCTCQVSSGRDL